MNSKVICFIKITFRQKKILSGKKKEFWITEPTEYYERIK